jgi:hypothetical protein
MSRERDPLGLTEHWHVDLRIESELPEDNVVGTRFLINVVFAAVALGALLFTGWIGYLNWSLRHQIGDWEKRIGDNRAEVADIKYMQKEYAVESAKIDQAFTLVKPQLYVTGFVAELGRTRPEQIVLDTIDWTEAGIIVRGNVRENSQRAALLLGNYTKQLKNEEKIGPLFREIALTSLDRGGAAAGGELLNFELTFRLKGAKP